LTQEELEAQPRTKQLAQVLLELSMVSHVSGTSTDSSGGGDSSDDIGGKRPPGGIDHKGDRSDAFRQKSADFFVQRYAGLVKGVSRMSDEVVEAIRDEILLEAESSLKDWRKTPEVAGKDPDWGTWEWKCRVADDPRPSRVVAGHYGISHVSVIRYRKQYKGVRA